MKRGDPVKVFSTCCLLKGAQGHIGLFTIPQGQYMGTLPLTAPTRPENILTAEHTNLTQAGQFGSAIGDVELLRVRAEVRGKPVNTRELRFELHVSGRKYIDAPLSMLLGDGQSLNGSGESRSGLLVARTDCFDGRIATLAHPVENDIYVRVEFSGYAIEIPQPKRSRRPCHHCNGVGYEP